MILWLGLYLYLSRDFNQDKALSGDWDEMKVRTFPT